MFFKANRALEKVADYTKLSDGTWVVEVSALELRVTGSTPTECRFRLLDEFDERIATWVAGTSTGRAPSQSQLKPEI